MRVFLLALLMGSSVLVTACSGGSEPTLRRSPSAARTSSDTPDDEPATPKKTPPASPASPAQPETPAPAPAPAPAPSPGTTPAPPPATPAPGSCGNPKCFAAGGFAGCKATDGAGATVTMGCQDGECACFAGGNTTATFDGAPNGSDDATQLFLDNCQCLL